MRLTRRIGDAKHTREAPLWRCLERVGCAVQSPARQGASVAARVRRLQDLRSLN